MLRRGITIRRSRAAGWARLAGGLALPVLALSVIGSRLGMIPTFALEPALLVGFVLGLVAFGLAVYSLADIWVSGAAGARAAIAGIVYASPVLVIIGVVAAAAIVYPRLTDVTTDVNDPPLFSGVNAPRGAPDAESEALQLKAYPDIVPRLYPVSVLDAYKAVHALMEKKRWTITHDVAPTNAPQASTDITTALVVPEDDELVKALASKGVMTQSRGGYATETAAPAPASPAQPGVPAGPGAAPTESGDTGILEATAPTMIFGFLDDVVVRIESTPDGAQVDMRSASRIGAHDLGQNARRIRGFLAALDEALQPTPGAVAGVASASE